jgi:phospholipid/cholesterol/gamma-HCH transport system permease protein
MILFLSNAIKTGFTTSLKITRTIEQSQIIGVQSLSVIILTGASAGGVLAYQSHVGLHRFGGEQFIGPIVFIAMVREFGPMLTGIMVAGRAGSAMTAEIGSMKITEQIDALQTLCINPFQYLVVPRILASTIILPFLSIFCSMFGILAGYIVATKLLGVNSEVYLRTIRENVKFEDISNGLIKATLFGFLMSWIATYKGYITTGGSKGVGISTTQSVVFACVAIFITDYIMAAFGY